MATTARTSRLVDHLGRPVELSALQEEQAGPSLIGVRTILSDHPSRGLTPQKLASLLLEAEEGDATRYLELAEDMEEKDLHYLSVLSTRKRAVSKLELTVEAASDDAEDERTAQFVRDALARDSLKSELYDVLDAIGKGYSVSEIEWEMSASSWVPKSIEWRDPRWFVFDRTDGRTLRLREGATAVDLAPWKFIFHVHKAKSGLPIRGGVARAAAWSYLFKNFGLKDWVAFAEVFGQPIRVGKYTPGASETDKQALRRAVANIGSDAAAVIPQSMLIEFIEAGSKGASVDVYERLCDFLDRQVSKAVIGQTLTSDVSKAGGSRALGDVHNEVRHDIMNDDAEQLEGSVNRDLVVPIVDLNFGPRKAGQYPRVRFGRPDLLTPMQKVGVARALVPLGLRVEASQFRDMLGMPEPDADAEVLTAPAAAPAASGGDPSASLELVAAALRASVAAPAILGAAPRFALGDRVQVRGQPHMEGQGAGIVSAIVDEYVYAITFAGMEEEGPHKWYVESELVLREPGADNADTQTRPPKHKARMAIGDRRDDAIDGLRRAAIEEAGWEALLDPAIAPLRDALERATSIDDLNAELLQLLDAMSVEQIADVLARAMFTARLAGGVGEDLR